MVNKKTSNKSRFCLKHLFKKVDPCILEKETVEETSERIRHAALKEFAEHGYEGARMQRIADKAEVNKALLHYHFKNKDLLYNSILDQIEEMFWEGLTPIIESPSATAKEFIEEFVKQIFEIILSHPIENQIFMQELAADGPFLKLDNSNLQSLCDQKVAQVILRIQSYVETGEIRPLDPIHLFMNIMSMCEGSFLLRPIIDCSNHAFIPKIDRSFYEKRCESIAELICHGVLAPQEEK